MGSTKGLRNLPWPSYILQWTQNINNAKKSQSLLTFNIHLLKDWNYIIKTLIFPKPQLIFYFNRGSASNKFECLAWSKCPVNISMKINHWTLTVFLTHRKLYILTNDHIRNILSCFSNIDIKFAKTLKKFLLVYNIITCQSNVLDELVVVKWRVMTWCVFTILLS